MTTKERLYFLSDLILCNHDLYFWTYGQDFTLEDHNFPTEHPIGDLLHLLDVKSALAKYTLYTNRPSIIETALGMLFIVGLEYTSSKHLKYHLIGPAMYGNTSYALINQKMDQLKWSIQDKSQMFRKFQDLPVVPTNILYQYAVMLHFAITDKRISPFDIYYPQNSESKIAEEVHQISTDHQGVWLAEQNLLKMIREGNPNYVQALEASSDLSTGIRFDIGDSLRQKKSSSLVLLTLCSRATIEGGLSPSASFNLCDYYAQKIEECNSLGSLTQVCATLLDDFVQRVREAKEQDTLSKDIQYICNYIQVHAKETLSISELAKQINYSDYYFTKKFKKETGESLANYIHSAKVEQAKLLLASSTLSINDISDELSFVSRSHFSTLFKKIAGCSPATYREQHQNL